MTPEERLKLNAKNLIQQQGCTIDEAIYLAYQGSELANKANRAEKLRKIKLQLEWDEEIGQ